MTTTEQSQAAVEFEAMEIEAITQVVARVEHAQRNELPEEFVGLFRADAIWTTGHGRRLFGREDIAAFTRQVLPGAMRESTVTYEVEHVLFIRPDVAAVKVRAQYRTPDGEPLGNPGSPMYVMSKEDGEWRLTACQNTEVFEAA
ncbi:SgcJ/EcaC family oxidoreductase [Streptomyces sp. NBC_01352]|uniref:SgcJ/EcaC family oxidoreductase n=1 Tax=Streptomyces plumbiresistens TaxID=511811 RepID=A0ABP7S6N6_9ACTN|nr:SgcJ/EcaC family oxidoreductase [Streptomyces sp. NBC_01352]